MALDSLRAAGLALGALGLAGTLAATLLPQWRVSAFGGSNIIVAERVWEGLWMTCVRQARAALQCKSHRSLLGLPPALAASRALMCTAVAVALAALLAGACSRRRVRDGGCGGRARARLEGAAGALLLLAGLFVLVPPSWTARLIVHDFHDPAVHAARKRELGASLFVGWASATALLAGGALLCASCCRHLRKQRGPPRRPAPRPCGPPRGPPGGPAAPGKPITSYV